MPIEPPITESQAESIIDMAVQRRLATDPAYRYAEDAETQSQREAEITTEEEARVYRKYRIR